MRILLFLKIDFSEKHDLSVQIMTETKKAFISEGFSVIRLGLEPRTPTLKVLCSTC